MCVCVAMYIYLCTYKCVYTYNHAIKIYIWFIICASFPVFPQIFFYHCFFSENIMIYCRTTTFNINEMLTKIKALWQKQLIKGKTFHRRHCIFVVCLTFDPFNKNVIIFSKDICQEVKIVKPCSKASFSFRSNYMTFFILGQSVQGIAAIPLYILGVTFIYNSVATHSAGIYLGKFFSLVI